MAEAPMQEPVAWMNRETGKVTACEPGHIYVFDVWVKSEIPLYAHPASEVDEWLKEAARRAIERLYANTNYSREGNPIDQQDCLNDDAIVGLQAAMVRLAHLRARHGADHASPRSDEKETVRLAALEEAANPERISAAIRKVTNCADITAGEHSTV